MLRIKSSIVIFCLSLCALLCLFFSMPVQAQNIVGAAQQPSCGGSEVGCEFSTLFSNKPYLIVCRINSGDPNFPSNHKVKVFLNNTKIRVNGGAVTNGTTYLINGQRQFVFKVLAPSSTAANVPYTDGAVLVFTDTTNQPIKGGSSTAIHSVCYSRNVPF